MNTSQTFLRLLIAILILLDIVHMDAQVTPTILRSDNIFIQQRIEKSDPEGWLYFNSSSRLKEGELFGDHASAAGLGSDDVMKLKETSQDEQLVTHNRYQ